MLIFATESQVMKTGQPTLEEIRVMVRELRTEASRLFQAGEIEHASKLFAQATRLEELIAPPVRPKAQLHNERGYTP
jgi:hypothetical protein